MNLGLISLICLLAAIVIGFVKNCNVGILCTGIAAVLALVFGIKASDINQRNKQAGNTGCNQRKNQ